MPTHHPTLDPRSPLDLFGARADAAGCCRPEERETQPWIWLVRPGPQSSDAYHAMGAELKNELTVGYARQERGMRHRLDSGLAVGWFA